MPAPASPSPGLTQERALRLAAQALWNAISYAGPEDPHVQEECVVGLYALYDCFGVVPDGADAPTSRPDYVVRALSAQVSA